jgi:hypothetical protein
VGEVLLLVEKAIFAASRGVLFANKIEVLRSKMILLRSLPADCATKRLFCATKWICYVTKETRCATKWICCAVWAPIAQQNGFVC